ncbi:MAG: hypothetical protein AAF750_09945 [Planctomycetota bacterium]
MPPPPLVQSTRAQRVVLAAVMAGLLLAALALVKTVTGAPLSNPLGPSLTRTTTANFDFATPSGWTPHDEFPGALIDPQSDSRQLHITLFESAFDSLDIARDEYVRAVPSLQPTRAVPRRIGANADGLAEVLYGITPGDPDRQLPELLHFIAVVQHRDDPNRFLAFRIVDLSQPDRNRFATNAYLLQTILDTVRFIPPGS